MTEITRNVASVLQEFLIDPGASRWGLDIVRATGLSTGTLYPILTKLEQAGWLSSVTEDGDPHELGRPRRRLHSLTDKGRHEVPEALLGAAWHFVPPGYMVREAPRPDSSFRVAVLDFSHGEDPNQLLHDFFSGEGSDA